ncbi:MAG: sugar phosphate isomerase/epimerase [Ruminococcaceae bacterium]|nr:sugar phosphate isomerase/epimerase [Oscillospiraceae bacterium]
MLKIGVQTARWYDKADPMGSLTYIKECGFDAIDLNIDTSMKTARLVEEGIFPTIFDKSVKELQEYYAPLKEASEKTGVAVTQMHAPFPVYYEGQDKVNAHIMMALDKCFAVAEFLGCPAVVVHPTKAETKEGEWELNLKIYRSLIPVIQKYKGVKICLENLFLRRAGRIVEGRFTDAADSVRMIDLLNEEAGGEYFGFCFDVGHATLTGRNVKEFVKAMGPRLTILHIHDNNGHEDQHLLPYSCLSNADEHVCDWKGLVEGLREIGYSGTLAFETFRVMSTFPSAVRTQVLKLIAGIGRYWSEEIEKK